MNNPFNPLNWMKGVQNWFSRTERSSGFRPFLIFLLIHITFALAIIFFFNQNAYLVSFIIKTLYFSGGSFILLFAIKCFQDPSFCRSEKHIETIKKFELMEQKGDTSPVLIDLQKVNVIPNPEKKQLPLKNDL